MGLTNPFKFLFQDSTGNLIDFLDFITSSKSEQLKVKALAINHAIDLIAKTIAKSEFKIYRYNGTNKKVESKKDDTYYRLNIKPNHNQLSTSFHYQVISKLLNDGEALIFSIDKMLYLADSFDYTDNVLKERTYKNIKLTNENNISFSVKKTYLASQVIHLTLDNNEIKNCIDNYFNEVGKLISIAKSAYIQANVQKWKLKLPGTQPKMKDPKTGKDISYEEYKNKIISGLFNEEDSVVMLSEQIGLENISSEKVKSSDDYIKFLKKASDDVAMAFNIPLDVFYGSKTDKSTGTDDFITFAVSPIVELYEDGCNATLIDKDKYNQGERVYINKLNMKHHDILDIASSLDKLTAIGFSHNEILEILDMPKIDEDWANEHYITKNYSSTKGGDVSE